MCMTDTTLPLLLVNACCDPRDGESSLQSFQVNTPVCIFLSSATIMHGEKTQHSSTSAELKSLYK